MSAAPRPGAVTRAGICPRCRQPILWFELADPRPLVVAVVGWEVRLSDRARTEEEERADPHGDQAVLGVVAGDHRPRWYWSDPHGELAGFEVHASVCPARVAPMER